jgi:hypothetical protein
MKRVNLANSSGLNHLPEFQRLVGFLTGNKSHLPASSGFHPSGSSYGGCPNTPRAKFSASSRVLPITKNVSSTSKGVVFFVK